MSPNPTRDSLHLFLFTVPDLPDITLALALPDVLEVTDIANVTPVPFSRPHVIGIGKWQTGVVTVVDLAAVLRTNPSPVKQGARPGLRYIVGQLVDSGQRSVVAWPILTASGSLTVPPKVRSATAPSQLSGDLVRKTMVVEKQSIVLVNLKGLKTVGGEQAAPRPVMSRSVA